MIQFFKDRTGIATQETMYPTKIQHKTPRDLFSLWFTDGEHTSREINGETFSMSVSDGCALFSPSHTFPWDSGICHSNVLLSAPALSAWSFEEACRTLWRLCSIPDTLITSGDSVMLQKVREIQEYYKVKCGWSIDHVVCPQLERLQKKWRWFVADSRKATGHYKKLPMGFSELCVFTPDWIVASLSINQPILSSI